MEQIADEMHLHLIHAAISPIISETNDCAHGIFHPKNGETIAQGRFGLPVFLANMQSTVQNLIPIAEKAGGFKPGDVWILNDPYLCDTHLQDVVLVAPHFVDGELFALLASTGHWMHIGGSVPGGWAPSVQDIHTDGVLIPPVKLYDQGKLNEALVSTRRSSQSKSRQERKRSGRTTAPPSCAVVSATISRLFARTKTLPVQPEFAFCRSTSFPEWPSVRL